MSNYSSLKSAIDANIKANGRREITGPVLNAILNAVVNSLGDGYLFRGVAIPSTNPGTPDQNVAYLAITEGTYTHMGGLSVTDGELSVFSYNGAWSKIPLALVPTKTSQLDNDLRFVTSEEMGESLSSKQDTIQDLSEIRSGAALGATAYQKPSAGIPSSDMTDTVQQAILFAESTEKRPYNSSNPDGKGYLVLKKNKTFAEQVTEENTIYEIRYDFNLDGASVTLPAGCILQFNGGKISNGILVGQNNEINGRGQIFDGITLDGVFSQSQIMVSWWVTQNANDNTAGVQNAVDSVLAVAGKTLKFDCPCRITDIDFTEHYSCGVRFVGSNSHNTGAISKIVVFGSDSQGLDTSGTTDIVFDGICMVGDADSEPKTLLFVARTTNSLECRSYLFRKCGFSGTTSVALIYNYAGELWHFVDCTISVSSSTIAGLYATSLNEQGLVSKFVDNSVSATPLTCIKFEKCSFSSTIDTPVVLFEGDSPSVIGRDVTVSNIDFDSCYFRSVIAESAKFVGVSYGIHFRSCVDESGVSNNAATHIRPYITIDSTSIYDIIFFGNTIYGIASVNYLKCTGNCRKVFIANNHTITNTIWEFGAMQLSVILPTNSNEKYICPSVGQQTFFSKFFGADNFDFKFAGLPKLGMGEYRNIGNAPTNVVSGSPGAIASNEVYNRFYLSTRNDTYGWIPLLAKISGNIKTAPTSNFINILAGDILWSNGPTSSGYVGAIAKRDGTWGTLSKNVSTTANSNKVTIVNGDNTSGLSIGQIVYIQAPAQSIWAIRTITDIDSTNNILTLNRTINATAPSASLTLNNPQFVPFGELCPTSANGSDITTSGLSVGAKYFDTTEKRFFYWDDSKWVDSNGRTKGKLSGVTGDRPTLVATDAGYTYFDTTLGKMIVWNGTAWVNMDGSAL